MASVGAAIAVALGVASVRADAQLAPNDTETVATSECVDTVTPMRFVTDTISQYWVAPRTIPVVGGELDLVSEHIASAVRTALGGSPSVVPRNDTIVDWRAVDNDLPFRLVIYRDKPTAWHADSVVRPTQVKLLAAYLEALRTMSADDLWIVWPPHFKPDSVVVRFYLRPPENRILLVGEPPPAVFATRMGVVSEKVALRDHVVLPTYPFDAERHQIVATVILQFVIDSTGHADPATITNLKPAPHTLDFPDAERYYSEFVQAARKAAMATTYYPARRGGCPVRQLVQAPFNFSSEQ